MKREKLELTHNFLHEKFYERFFIFHLMCLMTGYFFLQIFWLGDCPIPQCLGLGLPPREGGGQRAFLCNYCSKYENICQNHCPCQSSASYVIRYGDASLNKTIIKNTIFRCLLSNKRSNDHLISIFE